MLNGLDRSVLGASKAAPAGTLALQHMAGFDDQCAIVPFHKGKVSSYDSR